MHHIVNREGNLSEQHVEKTADDVWRTVMEKVKLAEKNKLSQRCEHANML